MRRHFAFGFRALLVLFAGASSIIDVANIFAAELPTAEEVLAVHQKNLQRLRSLHLQVAHVHEYTQAYRDASKTSAGNLELILKQIEDGTLTIDDLGSQLNGTGHTFESFKEALQHQLEGERGLGNNTTHRAHAQIFIEGDDYQVRTPVATSTELPADWKFPASPTSSKTLPTDFGNVRIFTRSHSLDPPGRVWCGASPSGSPRHVLIMKGHISDAQHMSLPPLMQALRPNWGHRHPLDDFFRATADQLRIVGELVVDDRSLLMVDAEVPHETKYSILDKEGNPKTVPMVHCFRAWLDMSRGALPIKLQMWHGNAESNVEELTKSQPSMVVSTTEVRELPSGGFYPAVTVREDFRAAPSKDPKAAAISSVHERMTWTCSLIEAPANLPESFFVLDFPSGQPFYDWETKLEVGALEPKPPIRAGEPAPPLALARWVDGESRTLEDLRSRVVVLYFWGLWCSACKNGIPSLKELQAQYGDQPVTFVAVHTAEGDADGLSERIKKFVDKDGWQFLQAIDSGTTSSNSQTCHAYGVSGFPTTVIIGPDGKVSYNSGVPPAGLEDIIGQPCDEATREQIQRIEAYMREQFKAAGVEYPEEGASQEKQIELMNRMNAFVLKREIDKALKGTQQESK